MTTERYSAVSAYLNPAYNVPGSFFEDHSNDRISCLFLVSCINADKVLFIEDSFELLTGYPIKDILKAGMDFWFPLIHPEDLPEVLEKIVQSHEGALRPGFDKKQLSPLVIEYRFKNASGDWRKIKDSKFLLMEGNEVAIDKILCRFDLLDNENNSANVEDIVKQNKSCTKMLEFALVHKNAQSKQRLLPEMDVVKTHTSSRRQLTRREKEILLFIGEGLSTKMIADKCNISINTVETHRRHLLEKLQVKNSMELIKEASKIFWL